MDILIATAELSPYSAHTAAAEAIAALPKALRSLEHRVAVISPLYRQVDPSAHALARRLTKIEVDVGGQRYACELYDGRSSAGVEVVFIGHPDLFASATHLADEASEELTARRAVVFSAAVGEVATRRDRTPDVFHGHEWVGALAIIAVRRKAELANVPCVLTIRAPDVGVFSPELTELFGVDDAVRAKAAIDTPEGPRFSTLLAGIAKADRVTTVSSTYASELIGPATHGKLGEALAACEGRFYGILDGVDSSVWNPATDFKLVARFDPMDLSGKRRCRTSLQRRLGLPVRDDVPLLATLARPGDAYGFDLFAGAASKILRNDCQVVVAYSGRADDELREQLVELSERWPDRIQVRDDDDDFSHVLLAAADLVLVPSRRETPGATQMIAHRYGALPIVRRAGSLADTVVDTDAQLSTGSGFVFDEPTPESLLGAVRRGFAAFRNADAFESLRRRTMRIDHSWDRSARLYERLYREARD
jgi:starch synthase